MIEDRGVLIEDRGATIEDRGAMIEDRGATIEDRGAMIEDRGMLIEDRGATIEDRGAMIEDRGATIEDRGAMIEDLGATIEDRGAVAFLSATAFHTKHVLHVLPQILVSPGPTPVDTQLPASRNLLWTCRDPWVLLSQTLTFEIAVKV